MKLTRVMAVSLLVAAMAAGCSKDSEESASEPQGSTPSATGEASEPPASEAPEETEAGPRTQAADCDWGSAPIKGSGKAVKGQDGDLAEVLVGAWQHTHIDTGSGFKPLKAGEDIRYIFPSSSQLMYCQDIKGVLEKQDTTADLKIQGPKLVFPGNPGYKVIAWDDSTMVWVNLRGNEKYLLARR